MLVRAHEETSTEARAVLFQFGGGWFRFVVSGADIDVSLLIMDVLSQIPQYSDKGSLFDICYICILQMSTNVCGIWKMLNII